MDTASVIKIAQKDSLKSTGIWTINLYIKQPKP